MNRLSKISVVFTLCLFSIAGFAQRSLNLDFEQKNQGTALPKNWYAGGEGFNVSLGSLEKHAGQFSLRMEMSGVRANNFGVFTGTLPLETFAGMYFWTWRTEEVLNMVEWMRKFNQPKQRFDYLIFIKTSSPSTLLTVPQ